jgi:hypothetical protein
VVGAWWEGGASIRRKEIGGGSSKEDSGNADEQDGKLIKLAHKLHMNTGKNCFVAATCNCFDCC